MKTFLSIALLLLSLSAYSQRVVTLTEDLVLTEPLVITEDMRYEGNGHRISCDDCSSAIIVKGDARVHFQDVIFKRGYRRWITVRDNAYASWESPRMKGHIRRMN